MVEQVQPATSSSTSGPDHAPISFAKVLHEELMAIGGARVADDSGPPIVVDSIVSHAPRDAQNSELLGLTISGGGIRSATFNLGVLQALAQHGWLQRVDYLSTVSGGGYIGAWLSAWIKRAGRDAVFVALAASAEGAATPTQLAPIDHLRRFSNYLTAKVGAMSADFWTGVATYLRNLLLNQMVVVPLLILALLAPWALAMLADVLADVLADTPTDMRAEGMTPLHHSFVLPALAFVFLIPPAIVAGVNFADAALPAGKIRAWEREHVIARLMALMLPASFCLALWLPVAWTVNDTFFGVPTAGLSTGASALLGGALYFLLVVLCGVAMQLRSRRMRRTMVVPRVVIMTPLLLSSVLAGSAGGVLLLGLHYVLHLRVFTENLSGSGWLLPGVGTVAVLFVLALTVVIHIGLMGRKFSEPVREWLGRGAAWIFIYSAGWSALFGIAFAAPAVLFGAVGWVSGAGGVAWLASSVGGVLFSKSVYTGTPAATSLREMVAQASPYIFMIGLLGLVASALFLFVVSGINGLSPSAIVALCHGSIPTCFGEVSNALRFVNGAALAGLGVVSLVVLLLMGWRIDINIFSFHGYYRNRISRSYLGASHLDRRPQPFTGFDEDDDLMMHVLVGEAGNAQRPFHIVNTALNLTRTNKLAWQERKAASFAITPMHCGYDIGGQGEDQTYLPTRLHRGKGLHIATAVATSGAAASPNMGYHSSLPVAFLMTLFNVRLGWWMPNTRYPAAWKSAEPKFSVWYILQELFGSVGESSQYVYLSDGGHFDNMGLYELIRRRCKYIVVCDAEADPDYHFEGIGNAIRKCRIDFNVDIELDVEALKPKRRRRDTGASAVVGTIYYPNTDRGTPGRLLYIKSSLLSLNDLPADVRNYAYQHAGFPHESTSDQWFGEAQFESYRRLGYAIVDRVLTDANVAASVHAPMRSVALYFDRLWTASKTARGLPRRPVTGDPMPAAPAQNQVPTSNAGDAKAGDSATPG